MMEKRKPNLAQYGRETILDADQMEEWLGCSIDLIERYDVPAVYLGTRIRRFIVGQVLDFFDRKLRRIA